jgi:hypothetical protein
VVKERVELYIYSLLRALMACCRANFTFYLYFIFFTDYILGYRPEREGGGGN